jgi:acyl carrier protein
MSIFDLFKGRTAKWSDKELLDKVRAVIVDELSVESWEVTLHSSLEDDLGCDELDFLELLMAIEKALTVMIPRNEEKNIRTVGDIIKIIRKYN